MRVGRGLAALLFMLHLRNEQAQHNAGRHLKTLCALLTRWDDAAVAGTRPCLPLAKTVSDCFKSVVKAPNEKGRQVGLIFGRLQHQASVLRNLLDPGAMSAGFSLS
jgi:hypothetical protein